MLNLLPYEKEIVNFESLIQSQIQCIKQFIQIVPFS